MSTKTRRGFWEYAKANPELRLGQAFVDYFDYKNPDPDMFYLGGRKEVEARMNDWQVPE